MKKKSLLTISIIIILILITSMLTIHNIVASASYQVDRNMNTIMDSIAEMSQRRDIDSLSSNPYDYVKDNENYKKIVALGPDALTVIKDKINNSKNNGLREYILAIAAEEVAMVDLKGTNYGWTNAKEWVREWDRLLRNIPDDVERITSSNVDDNSKNQALCKLGVAAVPYIIDKISSGNPQYAPTITNLLKDKFPMKITGDNSSEIVQWAKDNKVKYENLRSMVVVAKENQ